MSTLSNSSEPDPHLGADQFVLQSPAYSRCLPSTRHLFHTTIPRLLKRRILVTLNRPCSCIPLYFILAFYISITCKGSKYIGLCVFRQKIDLDFPHLQRTVNIRILLKFRSIFFSRFHQHYFHYTIFFSCTSKLDGSTLGLHDTMFGPVPHKSTIMGAIGAKSSFKSHQIFMWHQFVSFQAARLLLESKKHISYVTQTMCDRITFQETVSPYRQASTLTSICTPKWADRTAPSCANCKYSAVRHSQLRVNSQVRSPVLSFQNCVRGTFCSVPR